MCYTQDSNTTGNFYIQVQDVCPTCGRCPTCGQYKPPVRLTITTYPNQWGQHEGDNQGSEQTVPPNAPLNPSGTFSSAPR